MQRLLVQQVRAALNGFSQQDLDRLQLVLIKQGIQKQFKQVGYKCVECQYQYKGIQVSGFGRDDTEATHNCIKNFVDCLLESEENLNFIRSVLRELKQEDNDIELLGQKIGNISMINYQTEVENDQSLINVMEKQEKQLDKTVDKICCNHELDLKKEKLKVEHLELRVKLVLEENRILKSMLSDQQQKSTRQEYTTRGEDTKRMQNRSSSLKYSSKIPKLNLEILPNYHKHR
ncbi:hypothetical protein pb186bvf_003809 [Paramecium bursaria]